MRNYIKYYSGKVGIYYGDVEQYSEFVAANDKEEFDIAAEFIFQSKQTLFPNSQMRNTAFPMYFRMDKESILFVLNGLTKNGDVQGTGSLPAPAYRGQFDRENVDFGDKLQRFFLAKSPRRLKKLP